MTDSLPEKEIVTFSYAPFAHMMERQNLLVNAIAGGRIALFDQDISLLFTEIGNVAPTWLMAVPRVWNDVYSRFQTKVAELLAKQAEEDEKAHKKLTQAARDVARRRIENDQLAEIRASLGGRCAIRICCLLHLFACPDWSTSSLVAPSRTETRLTSSRGASR